MSYFVHEKALVDNKAKIGENTKIWAWTHIMNDVIIGANCIIGEHCFVENGVVIGSNVKIKNGISLYSGVVLEDDVFLGPNCVFTNVINPRSFVNRKSEFKQTIVKKGSTLGANATIVCGNTIHEYAMVGAGCVVTKDVMPFSLVIGNPAHHYAYICKCGNKLNTDLICDSCGQHYEKNDDIIKPSEVGDVL